jgi:putative hemolysin
MTWEPLALLCIGIVLSAFFSGIETGFYRVTRVRLVLDGRDGDWISRSLLWFTNNPSIFVATTLVGNNIANYLTSFAIVLASQVMFPEAGVEILFSVLFVPVVFLYGELIPKAAFKDSPNTLIRKAGPLFLVFAIIFSPIALALWAFARILQKLVGETPLRVQFTMLRHSLLNIFQQGELAGLLTENQRSLTQKLFACSSMKVSEVSRGLNNSTTINHDASYTEIEQTAKILGVTKLVVCQESYQNPIGVVSVLDMKIQELEHINTYEDLHFFENTMQVTSTLAFMQENNLDVAAVKNTRSVVSGIVYRQDLIGKLT